MPNIHDVLDECQRQCESMVKEIENFKSAKVINEQSAKSMTDMAKAMERVTKEIHPFTEKRLKVYVYISLGTLVLNSFMIGAFVIYLMLKG